MRNAKNYEIKNGEPSVLKEPPPPPKKEVAATTTTEIPFGHHLKKKEISPIEQYYMQRLKHLKERMTDRESEKEKQHLSSILNKEDYEKKKDVMEKSHRQRQKSVMYRNALERQTKREEDQDATVYYSLEMMHKSSPNQLPVNKINPERYLSADPTDRLYLEEY